MAFSFLLRQTLRHAIVGQLRHPPAGFGKLIGVYAQQRGTALRRLCARWAQQAPAAHQAAYQRAADELDELLLMWHDRNWQSDERYIVELDDDDDE